MSGILTIGVVLQHWLRNETYRKEFNKFIGNPIIREVAIFSDISDKENPIKQSEVKQFSDEINTLRADIAIAVDQEGGLVQRLRGDGFTRLPKPDDLRKLYEEGQREKARNIAHACGTVTAYELSYAGIHILYGPVFDTYNPDATVIGKLGRSYGNPPDSTDLLKHYLDGINGCLYTVAKHFPDHGQVKNDTHKQIAIDTRSTEAICAESLPPYQNLNYDALMIPHVIYSAVDKLPATLSEKTIDFFTGKLAKNSLPLFSDALEMNALESVAPTINERVYRCLESGCDALLYCSGTNYLEELKGLLTFIAEKKKNEPDFSVRYENAEEKVKGLSKRSLNSPPTLEEYNTAKKQIDDFQVTHQISTPSTPSMKK